MSAGQGGPRSAVAGAEAALLERLRSVRVRAPKDVSIGDTIGEQLRRMRQAARATSGTANAWDALLSGAGLRPELLERTRVVSFRYGVLTVRVADASTRYAVDRFLRGGGENALARLAPTTLKRVKMIL